MLYKIKNIFNKINIVFANNDKYIKILRKMKVQIGENCIIDKTAVFGTEPYLITLEDNVRITRGVKFITHDGGLWTARNLGLLDKNVDRFGKILVKENTNIGWNSIIMPGVTIGKNCVVGCNAVVTKDVPDNSVVAGIPARVIQNIEEYADKNKNRFVITKHMNPDEKYKFLSEYYNLDY